MRDVVTITVVKRQDRKRPPRRSGAQSVRHLIEGDDLKIFPPQVRQHNIEKLGGDFKRPVWCKLARPPRPNMVKHQDHAQSPGKEAKPAIGPGHRYDSKASGDYLVLDSHRKPI